MEKPVNIAELVDNSRVGVFQICLFILCGLSLIMDGFDMQAMGYVAPAIVKDWHVSRPQLGPVFSAAPLGVLFGSLLFSMVADKIGRRPVLVGATLFFAVLTLATGFANSVSQLLVVRFLAGLGLGCIMPNSMALVGEYSPRRTRITLMMGVSIGLTAGAAVGGFVSAWLIPAYGWRSVFFFGGAVPLLIGALMFFFLPESMQFLVLRRRNLKNVGKWLRKIAPGIQLSPTTQYMVHEENREGVPMVHLFREGRGTATVLLWIINFMNLLNLYFLANWLPTVVTDAGFSASNAVLVGTTLQVGGTFGSLALGWMIDRLGFGAILVPCFTVACISVGLIGTPALSLMLLFAVVFVAGFCIVGGQAPVNALAAIYYPTYLRSTGIGWGLGIGRIGAIVGPTLAGAFLGIGWSAHQLFLAAAIPAGISAVVMFVLRFVIRPHVTARARSAVMAH